MSTSAGLQLQQRLFYALLLAYLTYCIEYPKLEKQPLAMSKFLFSGRPETTHFCRSPLYNTSGRLLFLSWLSTAKKYYQTICRAIPFLAFLAVRLEHRQSAGISNFFIRPLYKPPSSAMRTRSTTGLFSKRSIQRMTISDLVQIPLPLPKSGYLSPWPLRQYPLWYVSSHFAAFPRNRRELLWWC